MGDLFGDADDISSDEEKKEKKDEEGEERMDTTEGREREDGEREERFGMGEGDEEGEAEEPLPETRIEVEIPRMTADLGHSLHFAKLPNFLSVETRWDVFLS